MEKVRGEGGLRNGKRAGWKRNWKLNKREWIASYLFILPICLQFLIFTLVPVIMTIVYSYTDYNVIASIGGAGFEFIGFDNFKYLFGDPHFTSALGNTFFLLLSLPVSVIFSYLLAAALNRNLPGRVVYRIIYYLPAVSSALAVGIVWKWFFNGEYGVINQLFGTHVQWLADPSVVKLSLIIKNVWGGMGGTMLLLLAGMQNLNKTYYEAAELDGAGPLVRTFRITLPMLAPVLFYVFITGVIGGMNAFADNYIMVGANDASRTVVFYMWEYLKTGDYGIVSAAALFLGIIVFLITLVQFKISRKTGAM